MSYALKHKIAIITGAGSGIGLASALLFSKQGAMVVVNDVDKGKADNTAKMITSAGGIAVSHVADVTQEKEVSELVKTTVDRFGKLDILFNNAGGAIPKPTHETSPEEYHAILALNLHAAFYAIHEALPVMMHQHSGVILSTSSGAGLNAVFQLAAYGAAKAGIINLTKNIAIEYGRFGIRANVISPGPMDTPGLRAWLDTVPGGAENYARQIPSGRLGTAEDIAHAAAFLVSDEAAFISGAVVPVDGAVHARLATPS